MVPNLSVLKVLTGPGTVVATGCEKVRVRYRLVVERRLDGVVAHGTMHGHPDGLHPIWLQPDALLQLEHKHRLDISVTDLLGDEATFESTGNVPEFKLIVPRVRRGSNSSGH